MDLSGTFVPMATPIRPDGQGIATETLADFTESLVDAGVHGLFPGSSIGEFPSLTAEQNRTVVRTVVSAADRETPVLAGCCGTSVDGVRRRLETAEAAGADAGVVVAPYYLDTTQAGLRRFYRRVADDSPLPVVLYNIPALTGNGLSVETVAELAEHDAVVGLKDTSGDLVFQHDVMGRTPSSFAVFEGMTAGASAALDAGVDGLIAGPANVFPEAMAELYEAHDRGDDATVTRLMREVVLPVVSAYQDIPTAAAVKYLLELDGLAAGEPLPPLATLSQSERDRLEAGYASVTESLARGLVEQ